MRSGNHLDPLSMSLARFRDVLSNWMNGRHGYGGPIDLSQFNPVVSVSSHNYPGPTARSGHRVFATGVYLYCVGGFNPELADDNHHDDVLDEETQLKPILREVWRFNLLTDIWEEVTTKGAFPKTMASFSMTAHDSCLLVFGGTSVPFSHTACNSVFLLPLNGPHKHEWLRVRCNGEEPPRGYGQSIVRSADDGSIFVIGGTSGFAYFMDVHRLKFTPHQRLMGTWNKVEMGGACDGRYRHESVLFRNIVYILGGGTRENVMDLKTIDSFDLTEATWRRVETFAPEGTWPQARRCHALVRYRDIVYILGGFDGETVFGDVWQLDMGNMEWRRLPTNLSEPVYFHSAAVTPDGCIYAFGGVLDSFGQRRSNKLFRMWLQPPSLKWSCMRRIMQVCPDLPQSCPEDLVALGIPSNLIKWLLDRDAAAA